MAQTFGRPDVPVMRIRHLTPGHFPVKGTTWQITSRLTRRCCVALLACTANLGAQDAVDLYQRAVQRAGAADKRATLLLLDSVSRAPGALDPGFHRAFFPYHEDSTFRRIVARIREANPPVVRSTIAWTIAERDLQPEGIAFDAVRRAMYLGSFKGKIVRVDSAGRATDFAYVSPPKRREWSSGCASTPRVAISGPPWTIRAHSPMRASKGRRSCSSTSRPADCSPDIVASAAHSTT